MSSYNWSCALLQEEALSSQIDLSEVTGLLSRIEVQLQLTTTATIAPQ